MDLFSDGEWQKASDNVDINENKSKTRKTETTTQNLSTDLSLKTTPTFNIPSEQLTDSTNLLEREQDFCHDNTLGDHLHLETATSQTPSLSSISSSSCSGTSLVPVETIKTVTPSSSFTSTPTQTNAQFSHPLEPTPSLPQVTSTHTSRAMLPTTTCYPTHFQKGSLIQLANGQMKKVEELETQDFINSAKANQDVFLDHSTLISIENEDKSEQITLTFSVGKDKIEVKVTAPPEHPFFVYGRSWSSLSPEASMTRYGLECHQLSIGDVCISLTQSQQSAASSSRQ